ncbi:MAG: IS630 family transposase [Oscillatoriales cyanobacterium]|nr:MAG: IS630 family transposase [Oscillatoriales cyanobacterium]
MNQNEALLNKPLDLKDWQKQFNRHQQEYIRHRLEAIKLLYEGYSRKQVSLKLECSYDTLTRWIDKYLKGGLSELVLPITHQKRSRLSVEQQQQLKIMITTQRPTDYGIERNMWTGEIIVQVLKSRFNVEMKDSRVYEILAELGLSYQRGHRDYANADPQAQKDWVNAVKKLETVHEHERIVFFDEFAVYDRPSLFYGWAERNTRPEVKSDESKRNKLNGMLCVDAISGEEFFRLSVGAKTENVSEYLAELCLDSIEAGYTELCIMMDRNPTHKEKMQNQLKLHLEQMGLSQEIKVEYQHIPAYSPKLNLVEYVIHLLRLRFLHHLPIGKTLGDITNQLEQFFESSQFLSKIQLRKTLDFIFSLIH